MRLRLLAFVLFCTTVMHAQALFIANITGSVVDSSTGLGVANYPVFISDSSSNSQSVSLTLLTDANGNYSDSVTFGSQFGTISIETQDSCSGLWLIHNFQYGMAITPSVFNISAPFLICDSTTSNGGGPAASGCDASFYFDSVLTGNGQIVLYNSSTIDSQYTAMGSVNYLWDFGDGTTGIGPFPSHQYTQAGIFPLCLTVSASMQTATGTIHCSDTYCDSIVIDSSGNVYYKNSIVNLNVYSPTQISIGESNSIEYAIYPNPTNGPVIIALKESARINIYSLNGQLILSIQGKMGENHVEKLPSGGYLIRILSPTGLSSSMLIAL